MIQVTMCESFTNRKIQIEIEDDAFVEEIKEIFTIESQKDVPLDRIRLFYYGTELKDGEKLYQHSIKDGVVINLMIRQISD